MPISQQDTRHHLHECLHMHHPQHASNAFILGVENWQWNDHDLKHFETYKADHERLNNCMNNGKKYSDILLGTGGQIEGDREEIETLWHRIKWTDEMVRLLINAVAYVRDYLNLCQRNKNQKKGKWRAISYVMTQRGYIASPQQCEDKYNDLNKKYKRLNDILGKGTAYDVVQDPSILDSMNLSDKRAEEIIKILSSKQFFYQEMWSYHNGNWLFLLHDVDLEQSLHLALEGNPKNKLEELIPEKLPAKRSREGEDHGIVVLGNGLNCNHQVISSNCPSNMLEVGEKLPNERWNRFCLQKIEDQKFKLEGKRLKLEMKRLKWRGYCQSEDRKLEKIRLENKLMKLQNQRLAFELQSHKQGRKL